MSDAQDDTTQSNDDDDETDNDGGKSTFYIFDCSRKKQFEQEILNIHDYQSNTIFQVLHVLGFDCTSDEDFDSDVSSRKDD